MHALVRKSSFSKAQGLRETGSLPLSIVDLFFRCGINIFESAHITRSLGYGHVCEVHRYISVAIQHHFGMQLVNLHFHRWNTISAIYKAIYREECVACAPI